MRHIPTLLRRELGAYFLGPMAYLILLAFQTIAWINFSTTLDSLSHNPRIYSGVPDALNFYLAGSPPFWIALMVALPGRLTMRLLAEERRSGTIRGRCLTGRRVTEAEVVVAKVVPWRCISCTSCSSSRSRSTCPSSYHQGQVLARPRPRHRWRSG